VNLSSIIELKEAIVRSHYMLSGREFGLRAESANLLEVDDHLIVGHSIVGGGSSPETAQYRLELRIQSLAGRAATAAAKIKDRLRGEASVAFISEISPAQEFVAKSHKTIRVESCADRPLRIGLPVGRADSTPGTIGAFVRGPAGVEGLMSCSHVLALSGLGKISDPIYQPGLGDGRGIAATSQIGLLTDFSVIRTSGANFLDVAIVKLEVEHAGNRICTRVDIPKGIRGQEFAQVTSPDTLGPRPAICKVGSATGFTSSTLTAAGMLDIPITLPFKGSVVFDDLIEITWDQLDAPFTRPGDSGSILFSERGIKPIGIHVGGGTIERDGVKTGVSYACNLSRALTEFSANLL
jgi:hypothetical protein